MRCQKKDLIYFLIIIPLFKPYCIPNLFPGSILDILFDLAKILILCYYIILIMTKRRYLLKNDFVISTLIYQFAMILAYSLAGDMFGRMGAAINCISVVLVLCYLIDENKMCLFRCISVYFCALLLANLVLFWIFPRGLNNVLIPEDRMNLLGRDNNYITWALLSFFCVCCYKHISNFGTLIFRIVIIINTLFLLSASSSTGLFAWALILVLYFFKDKNILKRTRPLLWISAFALINVTILLFNIQTYFENFISTIFKKDATFSSRTYIWNTMKTVISQHTLFGIGQASTEIQGWYGLATYSHNTVLDILLKGGFVALVAFVIVLLFWEKGIETMLTKKQNNFVVYSCIVLIGFMIEFLMEGIEEYVQLWAFLTLSYGICTLKKNESRGIPYEEDLY